LKPISPPGPFLADILDTPTAWLQVEGRTECPSSRRIGPLARSKRNPGNPEEKSTPQAASLFSCVREAVSHDAFTVVFQPILDSKSRCITGAEALLRWTNATHEANRPSDFVPVLETSGLIKRVGAKALDDACRQLRDLSACGQPLKLSVNISPKQFSDPALAALVGRILRDRDFAPDRLELEVTENAIEDFPRARAAILAIRKLGARVVIDDFGVGYSSLGHLKKLPVSGLKLDRSFVTEALRSRHDRLITESIIQLAHDLDLEIVAEGIEDVAHERWLCARGVDRLQGFLYSQGVGAEKLAMMLRTQPFARTKACRRKAAAAPPPEIIVEGG